MIRFTAVVDQQYVEGEEREFDAAIEDIYVRRGVAVRVQPKSVESPVPEVKSFAGDRADKMVHEGNRKVKQK